MAQNAISPGVYKKVIDLSTYVEAVPSTIGFICFYSQRGRDNVLMFASSEEKLLKSCGDPNLDKYGQGLYNADQFLRNSAALYYIRVMPDAAAFANTFLYVDPVTGSILSEHLQNMNSVAEISTALGDSSLHTRILAVYGIGRGTYYNNVAVKLTPTSTLRGINGYVFDVYEQDSVGDMVITESFVCSLDPNSKANGVSVFIENVVNTYSQVVNVKTAFSLNNPSGAPYIAASQLNAFIADPVGYVPPPTFNVNANWSQPFNATYIMLERGDDGGIFLADGKLDWGTDEAHPGAAVLPLIAGYGGHINASVTNTDLIFFTVVLDANYPYSVKMVIQELCMNVRTDCCGILDNMSPYRFHAGDTAVADSINDRAILGGSNWYTAAYDVATLTYDKFSGKEVWMAPSYWMSGIVPYTDSVADPWFAPAGFNRASLSGVVDLGFYANKNDRDQLYLSQINPIAKLKPGFVVWGQQTTYTKPSALRDLNIVRMLLYVDAALRNFSLFYIFEQNDYFTWNDFQSKITTFLEDIKARRGLTSYNVKVFASDYERQTNSFHADIWLQATTTVEKIFLNYYVTK